MALVTKQSHSTNFELTVEEIEWNRLKEFRLKEGFVGGKCLGEEKTLQSGFDHGYINGFEISYPISVIKGFLAVNELLLKKTDSSLLSEAEKIKQILYEFEKKCSEFKLTCIQFTNRNSTEDAISSDNRNENEDSFIKELVCLEAKDMCDINKCKLNEINLQFNDLKENILCFLRKCQQPLLLDQISDTFEKWDYQKIAQSDFCIKKYSDAPLVF